MKIIIKIIVLLILNIILTSCDVSSPKRIEPPDTPATNLPILIITPEATTTHIPKVTKTPTLTNTPIPTTTFSLTAFSILTPVPNWLGIPIMPNAISGKNDGDIYVFVIEKKVDDVYNFYTKELPRLGWSHYAGTMGYYFLFEQGDEVVIIGCSQLSDNLIGVALTRR